MVERREKGGGGEDGDGGSHQQIPTILGASSVGVRVVLAT